MAKDFLTSRTRTSKIIGNGSSGPKITIYPDTAASNFEGGIETNLNTKIGDLGSDVFLYVSGTIDGKENNNASSVSVFGGD